MNFKAKASDVAATLHATHGAMKSGNKEPGDRRQLQVLSLLKVASPATCDRKTKNQRNREKKRPEGLRREKQEPYPV